MCLLAKEEHLKQPGRASRNILKIFVVLLGPFGKFYHLLDIHAISVLSVVKYWEG